MVRRILAAVAAAGLVMAIGCAEDDDGGAGPQVTTTAYQGSVYDAVLDSALSAYMMPYDSSWYRYTMTSDGGYEVGMTFGMPMATLEEGTWANVGATYTFTPTAGWRTVGAGTLVPIPADSLPAPYAGTMDGTDLTFENFVNIQDGRSLGPITLHQQ